MISSYFYKLPSLEFAFVWYENIKLPVAFLFREQMEEFLLVFVVDLEHKILFL